LLIISSNDILGTWVGGKPSFGFFISIRALKSSLQLILQLFLVVE
jgi:hypothetical protein